MVNTQKTAIINENEINLLQEKYEEGEYELPFYG